MNMFEIATRKKFRFPFKGQIGVEDLWDLTVKELDTIFKTLNKEVKMIEEESLLAVKSEKDTILDTKINIVKHIVSIKLAEIEANKAAVARAEQKQHILSILADKEAEELRGKSIDELKAMLSELA